MVGNPRSEFEVYGDQITALTVNEQLELLSFVLDQLPTLPPALTTRSEIVAQYVELSKARETIEKRHRMWLEDVAEWIATEEGL